MRPECFLLSLTLLRLPQPKPARCKACFIYKNSPKKYCRDSRGWRLRCVVLSGLSFSHVSPAWRGWVGTGIQCLPLPPLLLTRKFGPGWARATRESEARPASSVPAARSPSPGEQPVVETGRKEKHKRAGVGWQVGILSKRG